MRVKLSFSLPRNSFGDKYYWLFWPALISPKFNYATRSPQHCEPRSKAYLVLGNEDKILYSHTQYSIFEYIKIKLYCLHHKQTYCRSNNTIARSQLMHTLVSTYLNIGLHLYPIFLEIAISGQWETWNKASPCKNMFRFSLVFTTGRSLTVATVPEKLWGLSLLVKLLLLA